MEKMLEKRRREYAAKDYPCYFCGCDLSDPKNFEGHGVHIFKVKDLPVYVCWRCFKKKLEE